MQYTLIPCTSQTHFHVDLHHTAAITYSTQHTAATPGPVSMHTYTCPQQTTALYSHTAQTPMHLLLLPLVWVAIQCDALLGMVQWGGMVYGHTGQCWGWHEERL